MRKGKKILREGGRQRALGNGPRKGKGWKVVSYSRIDKQAPERVDKRTNSQVSRCTNNHAT